MLNDAIFLLNVIVFLGSNAFLVILRWLTLSLYLLPHFPETLNQQPHFSREMTKLFFYDTLRGTIS